MRPTRDQRKGGVLCGPLGGARFYIHKDPNGPISRPADLNDAPRVIACDRLTLKGAVYLLVQCNRNISHFVKLAQPNLTPDPAARTTAAHEIY